MIDRDIHRARALLVESNPLLRSIGVGQLRDAGIGHVAQASRVHDARLMLERERYDIVVCSREFEGSDVSGQDLLDELQREKLLPHSTVFLMITSAASYQQVVEAAESALDGFLVRPYTAAALAARLHDARSRKRELADLLRALDAGDTEAALVRAIKRFHEKQRYWLYCGRLAAELLLTLHRPADAARLFERLAAVRSDASWAKLGWARALSAQGDNAAARKTVAAVLASDPQSADAHDLMGRILVDQCDFDGALAEYRTAAELAPGCMLRAQHTGALAYYQGCDDEALQWLDRALQMGVQSKLFDALTLMLAALLRHDKGVAAGVAQMRDLLHAFVERHAGSRRLQRFEAATAALHALLQGHTEPALVIARALAAESQADDFDLEAASVVLALWARVPAAARSDAEFGPIAERIAMRFCVSKAMAQVLAASARHAEPAVQRIRDAQARVTALASQAMEQSTGADPAAAVRQLVAAGEATLNAKLLEMGAALARRHAAAAPGVEALGARAGALLRRSCQAMNHIAGIQRSGRSPGALQLRSGTAETAAAVHAAA